MSQLSIAESSGIMFAQKGSSIWLENERIPSVFFNFGKEYKEGVMKK